MRFLSIERKFLIFSCCTFMCFFYPEAALADEFESCPVSWQPYVEFVSSFKESNEDASDHEFLFVGYGARLMNCLGEDFSKNYLVSLQEYLSSLRHLQEENLDGNSIESCGVSQITSDSPSFTLVRLPFDLIVLRDKNCMARIEQIFSVLSVRSQF